jgi:hypothetical protein
MTDITAAESVFHIRDLGSAGGTFIRIPHGKRKQLHPGKHSVVAVDCASAAQCNLAVYSCPLVALPCLSSQLLRSIGVQVSCALLTRCPGIALSCRYDHSAGQAPVHGLLGGRRALHAELLHLRRLRQGKLLVAVLLFVSARNLEAALFTCQFDGCNHPAYGCSP